MQCNDFSANCKTVTDTLHRLIHFDKEFATVVIHRDRDTHTVDPSVFLNCLGRPVDSTESLQTTKSENGTAFDETEWNA